MNKLKPYRGLFCAAIAAVPICTFAEDAIYDAISGGKVSGNFRLRYEDVGVDSSKTPLFDATALTLRSRLGYETAPYEGFTAFGEFEDTHVIADMDDYSPMHKNAAGAFDTVNIVDPEQTELNQLYLRYRGVPKLDAIVGRQRITLDNQRFIGNVGWRQNEQTFDALSASYKGIADWSFYYAYIDQVHGIANIKPNLNFSIDSDDHLLNVAYSGFVLGKITAYSYMLNNEENTDTLRSGSALNAGLRYKSNDTAGLRFDGNYVLPITMPIRLLYTVEYAKQTLETPTSIEFDTDYSYAELGAAYTTKVGVISAKIAQETLGTEESADKTSWKSFQTPYATKHAFMGWDDMFLVTPDKGLQRQFATLAGDFQPYGVKAMLIYSQFTSVEATAGVDDYGTEIDAQVLKQFGAKYTLGLKYASYSADDKGLAKIGATNNMDTDKVWLWAELNF